MAILNLRLPHDPVERVGYLSGVMKAVEAELDDHFSQAYYEARLQRRFLPALGFKAHSKKRALALCRRANNRMGRPTRWGDGLDASSSAYDPEAGAQPPS